MEQWFEWWHELKWLALSAWGMRWKLLGGLWSGIGRRGRLARVAGYYTALGDDIVEDFMYGEVTDRQSRVASVDEPLWLNLGDWTHSTVYVDAAAAMARRLADLAAIAAGSHVLEVGAGFGENAMFLAYERGASVVALDLTPAHVERAQRRAALRLPEHVQSRLHFEVADACDLSPFRASKRMFDAVVALECAFHFDTRERFFREALAALRPGGVLVAADMLRRGNRPVDGWLQRLGRWYTVIPRENVVDAATLAQQLRDVGFVNVSVESIRDHVFPDFTVRGTGKRPLAGSSLGLENEEIRSLRDDPDCGSEVWFSFTGISDYVLVRAEKPS